MLAEVEVVPQNTENSVFSIKHAIKWHKKRGATLEMMLSLAYINNMLNSKIIASIIDVFGESEDTENTVLNTPQIDFISKQFIFYKNDLPPFMFRELKKVCRYLSANFID